MTVVCKPANEGSCHLLIIQNIYPSGKFQICIEYYYLARIIADLLKEVKQYIDAVSVIRYISEFIQY